MALLATVCANRIHLGQPAKEDDMAQMDVGYALGAAAKWGDFERHVASLTVLSCLREPRDPERQKRMQKVLLEAGLRKLSDDSRKRVETTQSLAAITATVIDDLPSIAKALSRKSYLKTLAFDLDAKDKKRGIHARGIVSVGLIVKIVHEAACKGIEQEFGPDQASHQITSSFKKNGLFHRNGSDLKKAWMRNRSIAHLSAALWQYISDRQLKRFRTAERTVWRRDIVEYLEYANFFQHYLRDLSRQPKLRFKYDLLELPVEWQLARREPQKGL